jgi:hypothetical protein
VLLADEADATVRSDPGEVPARTCRVAPGMPSRIVTLVAVTVRGRVRSSPVPCFRLPNDALVYQSVRHGEPGSPDSACEALPELSPSPVPPGPTAVTLDGVTCFAGADGGGEEGTMTAGRVVAGAVPGGDAVAALRAVPAAPAAPACCAPACCGPVPAASW